MKTVTTRLQTHLHNERHMISCDIYELTLDDGSKHYFADSDIDVLYSDNLYKHDSIVIKREQSKLHDRVVVDNLAIVVYADKKYLLNGKPFLQAAHDGDLDLAKLYLKRCFFDKNGAVIGAVDLFGGNVEVQSAGGIEIKLSVKAKTQGLNMEFPIRKYYPQGSYTTNGDTVVSSVELDKTSLIAPYVPDRGSLL